MSNWLTIGMALCAAALTGCGHRGFDQAPIAVTIDSIGADAVIQMEAKLRPPVPGDSQGLRQWMEASTDSASYACGILPRMADDAPDYCRRLLEQSHSHFLVVDKRRMKMLVYDSLGVEKASFGIACGRSYGTKQEKADCRTPEGFLTAEKVYDSSEWLYTDDFGYTSPQKGQYGDYFVRLQTADGRWLPIGIHGTCSPWSIGRRSSHGCIRVKNEDMALLVEYVDSGMPVIISPSRLDMISNAQASIKVLQVATDSLPAIALTAADLRSEVPFRPSLPPTTEVVTDSIALACAPVAEVVNEPIPEPTSEPLADQIPNSETSHNQSTNQ